MRWRRRARESSGAENQSGLGELGAIRTYLCCFGNAFAEDFDLEVTEVGVKLEWMSWSRRIGLGEVLTVTDILLYRFSYPLAKPLRKYTSLNVPNHR